MHYEAVLCKPGTENSSPGAKYKQKLAPLHLLLALLAGSALTCIVGYSIPPTNLTRSWKPHRLLANLSGYRTRAANNHGWLPPAAWPTPSAKYSMLVPTYRRTKVLQDLLHTLNTSDCPSLDAIIISWQDINASIPDFLADGRFSRYPVKVVVPRVNDLNERFRVPLTLRTDAVLQYDDDLRIPCNDLEFAFQTWREEFQDRIVGFTPRSHGMKNGEYVYRMWNKSNVPEHGYSMILTNAAFIHRRYMDAYFLDSMVPAGVRSLVTELLNCEDIAMNFLTASITGKPPIYVEGRMKALRISGISTTKSHASIRNRCMNEFTRLFAAMPLEAVLSKRKIVQDAVGQTQIIGLPPKLQKMIKSG